MQSMLIDDSDTKYVQYSPNGLWVTDQLASAVDHTRHGAALPGLIATLQFHGTSIQVIGYLDGKGQPTVTFTVDGVTPSYYVAPAPTGTEVANVTFFSQNGLEPVTPHTLIISNVNGTSPNIFWLDYFLVDSQPLSSIIGSTTTSPSSTAALPSTPISLPIPSIGTSLSNSLTSLFTASDSSSTSSSLDTPSSSSPSQSSPTTVRSTPTYSAPAESGVLSSIPSGTFYPSQNTTSSDAASDNSAASSSTNHTAAIVGGVLGAVLVVAAIVIYILMRIIRRPQNKDQDDDYLVGGLKAPDTHGNNDESDQWGKSQGYSYQTYPPPSLSHGMSLIPDVAPTSSAQVPIQDPGVGSSPFTAYGGVHRVLPPTQ